MATTAAHVPAGAADAPSHVRGTIASNTATSLIVRTATGPVTVKLTPKTGYAGATTGSLSDIKRGGFLGIASVPAAGGSRALEVTVFPESMRGRGEGDYPWDLKPAGQHSAMTNGTVSGAPKSPHSMMTNATVSHMSSGATSVVMTYKGGSRTISIPSNAAVVKVEPGSSKLLAADAHVFVVAKKTAGHLVGAFVVVGENGAVPPM
ncbi:MAG: hypothetical protein M3R53_10040 [Candidatus Eremiobacteraeota bacterium]|nr:hypothetical protein [Candidatus Eremiobacteraeota bacterium]